MAPKCNVMATRVALHGFGLLIILSCSMGAGQTVGAEKAAQAALPAQPRIERNYGKLPLRFERNQGQAAAGVLFLAQSGDARLFVHPGAELSLELGIGGLLRLEFVGANAAAPVTASGPLPGRSHYFIGREPAKWVRDVPHHSSVRFRDLYPQIDLVYYGSPQQLEYDFIVTPGGDPASIRLRWSGHHRLRLEEGGDLVVEMGGQRIRQHRPRLYQDRNGRRVEVAGGYSLLAAGEVGIRVSDYDARYPLVIDPVLEYATHLGGIGRDEARGIAVDGLGFAYVTGTTESADFPAVPGGASKPGWNAFVTKLNPAGTAVVYSTILGGNGYDVATGISLDGAGNVYVAGYTSSSDFPVTTGAFQTKKRDRNDAFVFKLEASGSRIVYSTFLGSDYHDLANAISIDRTGAAHVVGHTTAGSIVSKVFNTSFPLVNPIQATPGSMSGFEAFLAKFSPDGTRLIYSTFLGGSGDDWARSIAVESGGSAYVAGTTNSEDFPTLRPLQAKRGGQSDAFVTKVNPSGTAFVYSTYLGGDSGDLGFGVAVDGTGAAYVCGRESSTDFLTGRIFGPGDTFDWGDAFVVKLNPDGSTLAYGTRIGGRGRDTALAIAVDALGSAHVTGSSPSRDFPVRNPVQHEYGGGGADYSDGDVFVAKIDPTGSVLEFSTWVGGFADDNQVSFPYSGTDRIGGIAVDPTGRIYVTGATQSPDFPATPNSLQTRFSGFPHALSNPGDAFVLKIDLSRTAPPPSDPGAHVITTLAGSTESAFTGAGNPALTTDLGNIEAVAIDPSGVLHIAHCYGAPCAVHLISRVALDGVVERLIRATDGYVFSRDTSLASQRSAHFNHISGMVFDKRENLLFAELASHRILRLGADGKIATAAGTGEQGFGGDGGPATAAKLFYPADVAVDDSGNLFIADRQNNRVRKVSPTGIISTVAGNGTSPGWRTGPAIGDGGPAVYAQLESPTAVAVAPDGTLYIAGSYLIRKVTPAGIINTVAGINPPGFNGDGRLATTAQVNYPYDLLLDREANLLIADTRNNRVRKIGRDGIITTIAGSLGGGYGGDGGPATFALIGRPLSIAMDSEGNLFVAESSWPDYPQWFFHDRIRKLTIPRPAPTFTGDSITHAASYSPSAGLARGSRFTIFGQHLGPARPVEATRYPLPTRLADVSVILSRGDTTLSAYLTFASEHQINAILPSDLPLGELSLTVDYSGFRATVAAVKVVENAFGFFFSRQNGQDAGVFQNVVSPTDYPLNSFAAPAKPGQIVIGWGTGLGPVNAPDYLAPDGGNLPVAVEVLVGGRPATVLYRGRAPGFAGVDNLYFEVPADAPFGCHVSVQARAGGVASNTVTIAITGQGEPCR